MPNEHSLRAKLIDDDSLKLMRAMELLHIKRDLIPSRYLSMFFFIAAHDPCHLKAVEEGLGISQGTASRGSDFLSAIDRFGKPGLGWISKEQDPLNATRMVVTLTPAGRSVVRQLKEILYG